MLIHRQHGLLEAARLIGELDTELDLVLGWRGGQREVAPVAAVVGIIVAERPLHILPRRERQLPLRHKKEVVDVGRDLQLLPELEHQLGLWADEIREHVPDQDRDLRRGVQRADMELRAEEQAHQRAVGDL